MLRSPVIRRVQTLFRLRLAAAGAQQGGKAKKEESPPQEEEPRAPTVTAVSEEQLRRRPYQTPLEELKYAPGFLRVPRGGKYAMRVPRETFFDPSQFFPYSVDHDPATGWTWRSQRTGAIAIKVGMTAEWNEWVVQVKTIERDGVSALQLGAGELKLKNAKQTQLGIFQKAGVPPKRKLMEFPVTPNAVLPPGTEIVARHFMPGQFVDVQAITKGKGFQGAVKRWGFKGGRASHGASLSHRTLGATGARQDPGKVRKGKKMPGRMGGKNATMKNLRVWKIDNSLNVLYVIGAVPGPTAGWVRVMDAKNKPFEMPPPFPTVAPPRPDDPPVPEVMVAKSKRPVEEEVSAPPDASQGPDLTELAKRIEVTDSGDVWLSTKPTPEELHERKRAESARKKEETLAKQSRDKSTIQSKDVKVSEGAKGGGKGGAKGGGKK